MQEALVHGLLEKLTPDSISLKVNTIGQIDNATHEQKEKEKQEEEEKAMEELRRRDKKKKNKARGKMKDGHV